MEAKVAVNIQASKENIWKSIIDIENAEAMISGIKAIKVLNKPEQGMVDFKWEETREMFGKEAKETMWITEAVENSHYATRAESHGSVYITKLSLKENDDGTLLEMTFTGIAQSIMAKIMSFLMSPLINSSIKKALTKDLEDIKTFVEDSN